MSTLNNFKTRFKERKKDFICVERLSNLSSHVIEEGHEMNNMDSIRTIIHNENNHEEVNKLEEIEILKEASSQNILNDVITGRNYPLYKIFQLRARYQQDGKPKEGIETF